MQAEGALCKAWDGPMQAEGAACEAEGPACEVQACRARLLAAAACLSEPTG